MIALFRTCVRSSECSSESGVCIRFVRTEPDVHVSLSTVVKTDWLSVRSGQGRYQRRFQTVAIVDVHEVAALFGIERVEQQPH